MTGTSRTYKGREKISEGSSPLTITGLTVSTGVKKGIYQAVRVRNGKESTKVDILASRTIA